MNGIEGDFILNIASNMFLGMTAIQTLGINLLPRTRSNRAIISTETIGISAQETHQVPTPTREIIATPLPIQPLCSLPLPGTILQVANPDFGFVFPSKLLAFIAVVVVASFIFVIAALYTRIPRVSDPSNTADDRDYQRELENWCADNCIGSAFRTGEATTVDKHMGCNYDCASADNGTTGGVVLECGDHPSNPDAVSPPAAADTLSTTTDILKAEPFSTSAATAADSDSEGWTLVGRGGKALRAPKPQESAANGKPIRESGATAGWRRREKRSLGGSRWR
ncbi:hypothetical protein LPJ59_004189 [Coemansia sp. RSA 2399]|nr:hypothetical protein LPJ59_004189 [Coemansia sp. RSA 2399]